jgi:tetraacyldisaccharide 4'-kinase
MDHREIMSGQRKDPLAFAMRGLLSLGELPYRMVMSHRNRGYDSGKTLIHQCGVPVISIGNLTTGGTGKTPLVSYIARYLRRKERRVAIVSRGYGAEAGEENDEAAELARSLPDVPHIQDADRVEAARIAVEELETEVIIMDDGFQHRRLHRDLDIVVVDATNPFGYGHLLPRGLLREPLSSLKRAHAVVISRANLVDQAALQTIRKTIAKHSPSAVIAEAVHAPSELLVWPDRTQPLSRLKGKAVALVSAIGNPEAFAATVRLCGAEVAASKALPDHDAYSPETVQSLVQWLQALNKPSLDLVCTHKDLVKLQTDRLAQHDLLALLIDLRLISGEAALHACMDACMDNAEQSEVA